MKRVNANLVFHDQLWKRLFSVKRDPDITNPFTTPGIIFFCVIIINIKNLSTN